MKRKAQIVALANQKGGVAKTTTCHVLAHGLANKGWKVLVVDTDPQENLTEAFDASSEDKNIYYMFKRQKTASECIQNVKENLDTIAGSVLMAGADMEFSAAGREFLLKESLAEIRELYDYIVIDTPPSLGIITVNVFIAADKVIIPMGADKFSVQGLSQLLQTIGTVSKYYGDGLHIDGILITRNEGTKMGKSIRRSLSDIMGQINIRLFDTVIRKGVAIQEAQYLQADPFEARGRTDVVKDYAQFINEWLAWEKGITEISRDKLIVFHTGMGYFFKETDDEKMEELVDSIKSKGILKPIIIRPEKNFEGQYEIIDGHRRVHAAEIAGIDPVPCLVVDYDDDMAIKKMALSQLEIL